MADKTRIKGNLVSDNNLFVNPTTDNTGIGTTSPTSKLHVVGNVLISGIATATSFYGDGSNLLIPKFLTIGVRSGTAVTFAIQNNSFNVINRSGLGVTVYTSY